MLVRPENWRTVPDALYEASTEGRVRRIGRGPHPNGRNYTAGKPTTGTWQPGSGGGRYVTTLRVNGRTENYKVARLVCAAFHGPAPFEGAVTLHLDENSRNNRPDNLRWGTQKENLNFPGFIEYCRGRTGANNPRVKGDLL